MLCLIWNKNLNQINCNVGIFVLNSDLLISYSTLLKLFFVCRSSHSSIERAVWCLMAKKSLSYLETFKWKLHLRLKENFLRTNTFPINRVGTV